MVRLQGFSVVQEVIGVRQVPSGAEVDESLQIRTESAWAKVEHIPEARRRRGPSQGSQRMVKRGRGEKRRESQGRRSGRDPKRER